MIRHPSSVVGNDRSQTLSPASAGSTGVVHDVGAEEAVRIVIRRVQDLRPHPSFAKLCLSHCKGVIAHRFQHDHVPADEPLTITHENYIIDGYARWQHAKATGRETLFCLEHRLALGESLLLLLQCHSKTSRLNAFNCIRLALELEPWLRERAHANEQRGGRLKGSSNLTEAERLDVRAEVARIAHVSVGNVTKVKRLLNTVDPRVLEACQSGAIRIHKAWQWCHLPVAEQRQRLESLNGSARIEAKINRLVARHRKTDARRSAALQLMARAISQLRGDAELAPLLDRVDELLQVLEAIGLPFGIAQ